MWGAAAPHFCFTPFELEHRHIIPTVVCPLLRRCAYKTPPPLAADLQRAASPSLCSEHRRGP